jgi:four helix bundle protein
MASIQRFEDIEAWKKARELTKHVYQASETGAFSRDFDLRRQVRRAAVSAMSNIAEGFERGGNREFLHFLGIAKGSAGEVRSHLYVALDVGLLDQESFERLYQLTSEVSRIIAGFIRYLSDSEFKGPRFT